MGTPPRYTYTSLPSQSIRVLELHPGLLDAPLECHVVVQQIDGKPYDALSYVWGDAIPVAFVKCTDEIGEGYLGIGAFLSQALYAFRLPSEVRRVWVDALCINQNDISERQSQVRLMGAVYGTAEHVLCWLGAFPEEEGAVTKAKHTISFLRRFNSNPREHLRAAHQHLHFGEDVAATADDVALLDSWLGIKQLFDIEYFHRAWIIQEVGLAQNARFYWGTKDIWLDWDEIAAFASFMDANGASIINHLGLKSWVANHINLVWANDENGKPMHNFVEVLHWARVHRSTDSRDYIYALLSHSSAKVDGELIVQPNYRITTEAAYTELAVNFIQRTNSLHILAFVDHHEEAGMSLPSWVPDWHALNLVAPLRCPKKAAPETSRTFSIAESKKGMMLKCCGFLIDTIGAYSDMFDPSELTVTTLEKENNKKIPFLVDHIWQKTVVEPAIPLRSFRELLVSLSLVLTGGFRNSSDSTSGENQEKQQADLAALILEYERIRLPGQSDGFLASLSFKEKELIQTMGDSGSAHQFVQDMTWTSMCRKVFRTSKGHTGLGPRIMRKGDVCVVLLGAVYPMVLRKSDQDVQLIGPALMYGFMDGEASLQERQGRLKAQDFQII